MKAVIAIEVPEELIGTVISKIWGEKITLYGETEVVISGQGIIKPLPEKFIDEITGGKMYCPICDVVELERKNKPNTDAIPRRKKRKKMNNLDYIYKEMSDLLGCPRDHRPMPNAWCDKMCRKVDKDMCWKEFFRRKEVQRITERRKNGNK